MSRYWSPIVSGLKPYTVGEQPKIADLVKLNTNESPYGPSPKVISAIKAAANDGLRLYPDPTARELREAIAQRYALQPEQIFAGNGSDEVLAHVFQALLKHDQPLLYPDVTYSFYPAYCQLYGIESVQVPLDDDFRVRVDDYDRSCGAIILPNPNAPTGIALPLADIEVLVARHADVPVVIDEAYVDFGAQTAVSLIDRYPNLLVVQTLSKSYSLAGLRAGFALGQRPLIEALERVKDSFNSYPLDRLTLAGATAAMCDTDWFDACRRKVIATRTRLSAALRELGFDVLPSEANFVFARHPSVPGAMLYSALRAEGVLVRHWNQTRICDYLRISVGTDAQTDHLLEVLARVLPRR